MQDAVNGYIARFTDYLEAERHASRYTVRNYRSDLIGNKLHGTEKGFFQFLDHRGIDSLEAVDKGIMREYLGYLVDQHVAKVSLARKLSAIRSFYRYLLREQIIERNPTELTVSPKLDRRLPEFLTSEEILKLISQPDVSKPHGQRDRAIIELLYAAGVRVSELTGLDLLQLDLDSRQLRVLGKGNKERLVIIGQPAARAISNYLKEGRPAMLGKIKTDAVFVNRYGARLSERWVQEMLERYAAAAGIAKGVHPHMLRHTFATHLLDGGADLRVVQDLLGHANLATTQIYTHVTQKQARRVYMAAHPMAGIKDKQNEYDHETSQGSEDYSI
jgi:integrase/recombinase XerC